MDLTSDDDIVNIFEQLGFETQNQNGQLTVNVPSRRKDISIKDLIEEVAVYMVMTKFLQRFLYLKM